MAQQQVVIKLVPQPEGVTRSCEGCLFDDVGDCCNAPALTDGCMTKADSGADQVWMIQRG